MPRNVAHVPSHPRWSAPEGGTLNAKFAISNLNGCGPLNGLVSPLTAGSDNSLTLAVAPKSTS